MSDFVGAAINTADLTSKLTGIAVDFLTGIGCEAFCEVLDIGKDFLFEALRSGKINHQTKKALESLDQRTVDDLKHFVSQELQKYSKKGKLPKKLKGKDLVDVFMNRLDTVSKLVDDYAAQNNLSEDRKIALKYILNEIRQCTAQASLDMLEAEDKRLVLVISQIVRNTFEDYREDFAPQLAKTLFYRPTNCTYCASSSLLYDDAKGIAACKNCGTKIEYTKSEQPDLLAEAKAAFSGELDQLNNKLDKLMELSLQTLSAVQSIDGKVETVSRTSDLKSRLNLAQDRVNNYEFTEACNTCRTILKDYPDSVDALWCYLQAEFGIVYLRGYNESYAKPTFCYPMDRASKIRFCDHEYYKKIMLLLKEDPAQRSVYEARQREIDKAIATLKNDLSKKPEYDVFICVKIGLATDNNQVVDPNSKTVDFDQYAQRIYRELTGRGLRVFCSQISQAQGIAYDEQIWSAMLRSKKILVIGTRREYLESVWVQCEWRRWMYLRHIGVRAPDSFVALIPSEDEWSYIRPREWDEQRITIYTDIDSAINAIIDTPTATVPTNPDTQSRLIRDIRVLLDMDQDFEEAEARLKPLLRATPSNGELRWLSLRIKSADFTDLSKITPQAVEVANRCLRDDGKNPDDNLEYRMYLTTKEYSEPSTDRKQPTLQQTQPTKVQSQEAAEDLFDRADRYYNGLGVPKDYKEAARLFKLAADQGHVTSLYRLGGCYYHGKGVAQNQAEAIKLITQAANQGLAAAQYDLGRCYRNGWGVKVSLSDAIKWYQLAAQQEYAAAQSDMGYFYHHGIGVNQSYAEALKYYRLAANQGYALAQNNLGLCYMSGFGVSRDYGEAVRWYKLAVDQGASIAQYNLGRCYQYGWGVTQNYAEAVRLYRLSADQGYASAQNNLGLCYQNGTGIAKSYPDAIKWYKLAADQGTAAAQYNLGRCYRYGWGVTQNYTEAVRLYRLAADQDYALAQNNLGLCYHEGIGVSKSYEEAVRWYRLAAEQGAAVAQYNLGRCYRYGWGVQQNDAEAVRLFKLAADQGYASAQNNLGVCYMNGKGVKQDYSEAFRWYKLAANQDDTMAQYNLGYCYYHGKGTTKNVSEAIRFLKLAAAKGNENAKKMLAEIQ